MAAYSICQTYIMAPLHENLCLSVIKQVISNGQVHNEIMKGCWVTVKRIMNYHLLKELPISLAGFKIHW